jgi:hypothetical protein
VKKFGVKKLNKCKFCKKYISDYRVNKHGAFFHKGKPCHIECGEGFLRSEKIWSEKIEN